MMSRFQGADGMRRLVEALRSQRLVEGDESLAAAFAEAARLRSLDRGDPLVSQGGADNAIFFLCAGAVSVRVNGRQIAIRRAGEHVGEMALIDPRAPRSATLIAVEPTVAAEIGDTEFHAIAKVYPRVWQAIARTLADRLRERDHYVRPRESVPGVFVGCSSEGRLVAEEVKRALSQDDVITQVASGAPHTVLETLQAQLDQMDFSVLIVTPNETPASRGKTPAGLRDSVIFELGSFAGALGRGRTFVLKERGAALNLSLDLAGFTRLEYQAGDLATLHSACEELRLAIAELGPR